MVGEDKNGTVRYKMNSHEQAPRPEKRGENNAGGQTTQEQPKAAQKPQNTAATSGTTCPSCGGPISKAEQDYSVKKYGRELCRSCQKNA